jgi:hypothetical protein
MLSNILLRTPRFLRVKEEWLIVEIRTKGLHKNVFVALQKKQNIL